MNAKEIPRIAIVAFVLAVNALTSAAPLGAQFCLRGRPAPECDVFLVTEAGVSYRLYARTGQSRTFLTGEYGAMANLNERNALGATFWLGLDTGWEVRIGLKPRYRRWLSTTTSLDLSVGVLCDPDARELGLTGHASYSVRDYLLFITQLDIPDLESGSGAAFYGGIRVGSYPGFIVSLVSGIAALGYALANLGEWMSW